MYANNEKSYNNYVWDERTDLLGTGATSNVYKARCRHTGQFFAVKVFTESRRCVVNETLLRELSILEMVDHKNIVKLIKDDSDRRRQYIDVIIMEYCNGGSLAAVIEKPENYFGLPESEFLLALKHITDGMIELHRKKIAHRDIKPNNILLHILSNGEHVYKITDFGAAKNFESAALSTTVGTEEYLYPEIYARAFYNESTSKLTPGIDLWSIGVTLYHVATGKLPFRPYDGCRRDRDTMIRITREKPRGAISGVQNVSNGPIEYSEKLPEQCQLSNELKSLLEPMLGGLIETKLDKMWPFEKYFEEATKITNLIYVNLINSKNYEIFEVALKPSDKFDKLQASVQKNTKINNPLMICNNLVLTSIFDQNREIGSYTMKMDEKNPLVLFSFDKPDGRLELDAFKEYPRLNVKMPNRIAAATSYCKEMLGHFFEIERKILKKSLINESLKQSALTVKTLITDLKSKQDNLLSSLKHTIQNLETKSASFAKIYDCISRLDSKTSIAYREQKFDLNKIKKEVNEIEVQMGLFGNKIRDADNLAIFMKDQAIDKMISHIHRINEECEILFNEFQAERRSTYRQDNPLSQAADFRCKRLANLTDDAYNLYNNQFLKNMKEFFQKYDKWFQDMKKVNNDISEAGMRLKKCEADLDNCKNSINDDIDFKLNRIIDFINGQMRISDQQQQPQQYVTPEVRPRIRSVQDMNNNQAQNNTAPAKNNFEKNFGIGFEKILSEINSGADEDIYSSTYSEYKSIQSLVESIHSFKEEATHIDKVLDDSNALLKYLNNKMDN